MARNGGHDYQRCKDADCPRITCQAYRDGHEAGFEDGYGEGFAAGRAAGAADTSD